MQTLNVGAGRTDQEYQADEEQRRGDLLSDSRSDANYFFIAAGLAVLSTGVLPIRLLIFVNIGAIDMLTAYAGYSLQVHPLVLYCVALIWVVALVVLGLAAKKGH